MQIYFTSVLCPSVSNGVRIYSWRVCGCWKRRGNCANCVPTWRLAVLSCFSPAAHTVMTRTGSETPAPGARQLHHPASHLVTSRGWLSQYRGAADDAQVPSPTSPYLTLPLYLYPDLTHFSQRQIIKINPTWRLHLVYASVSDNEYYEHAIMIQLIH